MLIIIIASLYSCLCVSHRARMLVLSRLRTCRMSLSVVLSSFTSTRPSAWSNLIKYPRCITHNLQPRTFSTGTPNERFFKFPQKTPEVYKKKDGLSKEYSLVQQGSSNNYVVGTCASIHASYILSVLGLSMKYLSPDQQLIISLSPVELMLGSSIVLLILSGMLKLIRTYPFRIYYNEIEDKFAAVFVSINPLKTRIIYLLPGEVRTKKRTYLSQNIIPWDADMCTVKGKHDIILMRHSFVSPVYYNKLIGYK